MNDYQNISSIYDNSNIKLTMEKYGYNLWGLIALISVIYMFNIINYKYLYIIMILIICSVTYFIYFTH